MLQSVRVYVVVDDNIKDTHTVFTSEKLFGSMESVFITWASQTV